MIKNYLKTALRSILHKKVYSLINLLGLAIGMVCSLLIITYVHFEVNFDRFHPLQEQIYRINTQFSFGDISINTNQTPAPVLGTLLIEFPEVSTGTRVFKTFKPVVMEQGEDKFQENNLYYADSTFFDVFDFPLISGNPSTALSEANSVVFSKSSAIKYFGTDDIVNQNVVIDNKTYLITAVAEDPPDNTHLQFDFLASFVSLTRVIQKETWDAANYFTFLVLNEGTDPNVTSSKLQAKVEQMMGPFNGSHRVEMKLMALGDIHLLSDIPSELFHGDITYVYIFSFIALLITLIACVNYMNLSTARSVLRAKEVGIRKVLGAYRPQLFFQFVGESAIITGAALIFALIIAYSLIPQFAQVAGRPLDTSLFFSGYFYVTLFVFWVSISFIAGTYPAFVLSSYSPGSVLKSSYKDSGRGVILRKALVVFQFGVAVLLFIGSAVMYQQMEYMQEKSLGYDKEKLVILPADRAVTQSFQSFKAELMRLPEVKNAALANESLAQVNGGYSIKVEGSIEEEGILTTAMIVSPDFVKTTGLKLKVGEDFNQTDLTQSTLKKNPVQNILINEEAARFLYLDPEEAIGLKSDLNGRVGVIKGVLEDFHFRSLKEKIQPIVLFIEPSSFNQMVLRVETKDITQTINSLKSTWENSFQHRPFDYRFVDEEYNALYESEQQLKQVYSIFTGLAIFIGCLGLLGLVSYTTVQREKEIGIRKILGATINSIVALISTDFIKLVMIGFVLATPIAYLLMQQWLSNFEYRVDFSWQIVAITLIVQVVLALLVTSTQSVKAALRNPVETIRNE